MPYCGVKGDTTRLQRCGFNLTLANILTFFLRFKAICVKYLVQTYKLFIFANLNQYVKLLRCNKFSLQGRVLLSRRIY